MRNNSFQRTDEWRQLLSDKIRLKWNEPDYRVAVSLGLKASFSNRTRFDENGDAIINRARKSRAKTKGTTIISLSLSLLLS